MLKCVFKGCAREGLPSEGLDFYACDECCEELECQIADLWDKELEMKRERHARN